MSASIDDLIDWTVQAEGWHHVGSDVRHLKKVRQILSSHQQLAAIVERYMAAYPAFRMKPVGSPGSQVRDEQERLMALEDAARAALASARA
jgi:hypothetical protein